MVQSESALALTSTFSPVAVRHFSQSAKNTDNPYGVIVSTYCLALMRDESSTIEVIEDLLKSNNPDILDDLIYSISAFDRTEFSDALQSLTKTELLLNNDKLMEQTLKALSRLARASVTN
jgi:hypothetical protein